LGHASGPGSASRDYPRIRANCGNPAVAALVFALVLFGGLLALMILTGLGAYRRGLAALPASLAGLVFPIARILWYLRDERPYRNAHRHPA
jgi:hypothetical protein